MEPRCLHAGPKAVAEAARIIKAGGLVAIPTDTVYGLACDPTSAPSVKKLFEAKGRAKRPVPVLCSNLHVAERLVSLDEEAMRLANRHWPGALTVVASMKEGSGLSELLHQGSGFLGVRVPSSAFCVRLAQRVGGVITGTSANLSGEPSCRTAASVIKSLDGRVELVVDGGRLIGKESTVVKVTRFGVEVLREGSVRIQEGGEKA